jgi:hypothetical protein
MDRCVAAGGGGGEDEPLPQPAMVCGLNATSSRLYAEIAQVRGRGMSWLVSTMLCAGIVAAIHRDNRVSIREAVPTMRDSTRASL